jgi:LacI family transcriptional regulator
VNAPVSIRDVAAHAGVSVGTVSNVLNRPEIVARTTRDRVHVAIKALGFVRNESARQLRAGRSRTIGLVVLDVANPFFTDVARGVEDEAAAAGLAVILCNTDEQLEKEQRYLELLEEHRVQGILITPTGGWPRCSSAAPRSSWSTAGRHRADSARSRWTTCWAATRP